MSALKNRLKDDLHAAIKARDELTMATLRMALTAVSSAEVAGPSARELSDDDVLRVLAREAKARRESAEAYDGAGRGELAARERAELGVLEAYLPAQLGDEELAALVGEAIAATGATGMAQMGAVMKAATAAAAGRAEGGRIAALVRARLSS